ncbi:hypothetical protein [Sphingomonas sp.]|uniref:hypothetical protein n=1 Tax=Sphingomonas sp. TaxID=28214 RepID=UPI002DD65A34|nr:hypothetical protein [Sphingomonas sp.]
MLRMLVVALTLAVSAAAACAPQTTPGYDPDRLSEGRMEALVAGPIEHVRAGDLDRGIAELEQLRSAVKGADAAAALLRADIDESFGVLVDTEGQTEGPAALRAAAVPFLKRAVGEYRGAFGPAHPEVALALQSWADVLRAVDPIANLENMRSAYCDAFRIRLAALGPDSAETGSALAEVMRLAPPGTVDAAALRSLDRSRPLKSGSPPLPPALTRDVLAMLEWLRGRVSADRQSRDEIYRTLAGNPRFAALCPATPADR